MRAIIKVDVVVVRDEEDEQCDDGRAGQDGAAALGPLARRHRLWSQRGSLQGSHTCFLKSWGSRAPQLRVVLACSLRFVDLLVCYRTLALLGKEQHGQF